MANGAEPDGRSTAVTRVSGTAFETVEHAIYVALASLLALTAVLALGSSALALWQGVLDWTSTEPVLVIMDRLLVALMLIEIMHTVRASIRTGALVSEPFLVVGLIASIRRMLVITLESSQVTRQATWSPKNESLFRASMLELAVLSFLIAVLVGSIVVLRHSRVKGGDPE